MKVAESTVGTRGAHMIPVAIQKALDLHKGDKLGWYIDNQHVTVRKEEVTEK